MLLYLRTFLTSASLLMFCGFCLPAFADSGCVSEYLAQKAKEGNSLAIARSDAEELIEDVAASIGLNLSGRVTIVSCHFARKAVAWQAPSMGEVPEGEYIIYNDDWVREVIGDNSFEAVFLFGHELGHLFNRHFSATAANLPLWKKEAEADQFGSCAVAKLGGTWETVSALLRRLRKEKDEVYPALETSLSYAAQGFRSCGPPNPKRYKLLFPHNDSQLAVEHKRIIAEWSEWMKIYYPDTTLWFRAERTDHEEVSLAEDRCNSLKDYLRELDTPVDDLTCDSLRFEPEPVPPQGSIFPNEIMSKVYHPPQK